MTILHTHPDCLKHNPGQDHLERPKRPNRGDNHPSAWDGADFENRLRANGDFQAQGFAQ
jgi:hypothetical protein